jgi:hypothetical protein
MLIPPECTVPPDSRPDLSDPGVRAALERAAIARGHRAFGGVAAAGAVAWVVAVVGALAALGQCAGGPR